MGEVVTLTEARQRREARRTLAEKVADRIKESQETGELSAFSFRHQESSHGVAITITRPPQNMDILHFDFLGIPIHILIEEPVLTDEAYDLVMSIKQFEGVSAVNFDLSLLRQEAIVEKEEEEIDKEDWEEE